MDALGRVMVKEERCKGCGYCVTACRQEILALDEKRRNKSGYNVVICTDTGACTGCALCAEVCPDVALVVYR
ncbi:MAG: 4Fe-4S binding protein [Bacillota bacterium]|nr:4Fe-4S binding protein [Bacillota bacterium]